MLKKKVYMTNRLLKKCLKIFQANGKLSKF